MILETGLIGLEQPWWVLFFAFVIGHAFADYPLQGEFLALQKNHRLPPGEKPDGAPKLLWFHCLTAHSLIHGGFVWLISGVPLLGVAEFILHWVIDFMKSEGVTNFHVDQTLHILCKVGYVVLIYGGYISITSP